MPPHRWCLICINAPKAWESSRPVICEEAVTCGFLDSVLRSC
nr:hypothetical protein JVH1_8578 [Rhodococcus sp. JVH1]